MLPYGNKPAVALLFFFDGSGFLHGVVGVFYFLVCISIKGMAEKLGPENTGRIDEGTHLLAERLLSFFDGHGCFDKGIQLGFERGPFIHDRIIFLRLVFS